MKRPSFTINQNNFGFELALLNSDQFLVLKSKKFPNYKSCEKFLATLKVHMCFHANFCRTKNISGNYGFEIRTCWDELIATSIQYASRELREEAMQEAFAANKNAIFVHKPLNSHNQEDLMLSA